MTRNLYALLVGIDDYPARVPKLDGCVNDINAIEDYLKTRVDRSQHGNIKTLRNAEATRQAVIDSFEKHLRQAGKDDVVLFYFCGHGSQEPASPEFSYLERDGKLETLVCWDSRTSARDLANKELRYLIAKVAQRNPHIVIVLDSCHSGSGTRDVEQKQKVRHTPADTRPRKIEEFIFANDVTLRSQKHGDSWDLPEGRHVLLAACQDREKASEYSGDGKTRGAFSYFLLDALNKTNSTLSYREFFKEVSSRVRSRIKDQTPRLEANIPDDLDNLSFLGGSDIIKPREPFFTLRPNGKDWEIDGGAIHGFPKISNIPIKLALYSQGSTPDQMRQLSEAVGEAKVIEVLPDRSIVEFTQEPTNLTEDTILRAIAISLPPPTIGVYLEGDSEALERVRQQLRRVGPGEKPSLYIREEHELAKTQYRLLAKDGQYVITKPSDDCPLVEPLKGYDKAFRAVKNLEHIARWTTTIDLANPESQIPANAVKVQIDRNGKEVKDPHLRLEYEYTNGEWQEPTFRVKLTNTYHKRLFCAFLDVAEDYAVSVPPLFPQGELSYKGGLWIEPGEEVCAALWDGNDKIQDDIPASVPDKIWEQGVTEYQDVFKLIVSTAEFDATLLEQENLSSRSVESSGGKRALPSHLSTLNLLMYQIQSRQIGVVKPSTIDDWVSSQISITTVRPKDAVSLSDQAPTNLSFGVTIQPHSGLRADARLSPVPPSTRDLGSPTLPPILGDYTQPFQFTASRGVDSGLSVLELQVNDRETIKSVTPENPLVLSVNKSITQSDTQSEYILPVAYDGEFFLPLGYGKGEDSKTEIRIERLPTLDSGQTSSEKKRSLGGAIRIYFQKVIYENLGQKSSYPKLRVARVAEDGTVSYEEDEQQIKAAVANVQRIALYIHGIIGDTESMVPSVQQAKVMVNGQSKSLAEIYDLVLTFDYESLNTPIKELGQQLRDKLAAVGLKPSHGKTLHIVAHSMGGLVSRSFIEQWEGNQVVQHLIMLGTPNAGSPWAAVHDLATFALAAGLNSLSSVVFPAKVLAELVALIEKIDVNLDEMHPTKSKFLQELKDCADPQCPYSIIAGNTSLIPPQEEAINRLQAALQRTWRRAIEFPFMKEANDIAVTVKSIVTLPEERSPAANIQDRVACDHLSYFRDAAGLDALANAVRRAFSEPSDPTTLSQKPQSPNPNPGTIPGKPRAVRTSSQTSQSQSNSPSTSTPQSNPQSTLQSKLGTSTNSSKVSSSIHALENEEISSVASTNSSLAQSTSETTDQPSQKSDLKRYAVVIGIKNYEDIACLETPLNDAREVAMIFEECHNYELISPPNSHEKVWLDKDATLAGLRDLLEKTLPKTVHPEDCLLFYYAGHGHSISEPGKGPQGYLIPQDATNGQTNTYLSMKEFRKLLIQLECRHCLLVLDCCYSGAFGFAMTRQIGNLNKPIYKETLDWYKHTPAWQVITSTNHQQTANDVSVHLDLNDGLTSNAGHSPFASHLIEALTKEGENGPDMFPKDGIITAQELLTYLKFKVTEETRDKERAKGNKNIQTPGLFALDEKHKESEYIFFTKAFDETNLDDAPELAKTSNPYRGWEPYTEEHSEYFFGRQNVINQLCDRVCDRPLTVLLGESGSGKSSLVNAGLIPHLKRAPEQEQPLQQTTEAAQDSQAHTHKHKHWKILPVIHPDDSPVENLERVLNGIWKETQDDDKVLLVIDQFEELTQCSEKERNQVLQRLIRELNEHPAQLRLVLTLRSDFEPQLQNSFEALLKSQAKQELDWNKGRFHLPSMKEVEIEEAIEGPALKMEVRFEPNKGNKRDGRTLVEYLADEVKNNMPGALPWLSFALSKLYEKLAQRFRDAEIGKARPEREIKWHDYDELRKDRTHLVSTLVSTKANEVYEIFLNNNADKKDAFVRTIRNLMLRMITVDGNNIIDLREAVKSEWSYPNSDENDRAEEVINRFVIERLLVKGFKNVEYVKPSHKSLVRDWGLVKTWMVDLPEVYRSKAIWQRTSTSRASQKPIAWLPLWRELTDAARNWQLNQDQPTLLWNARSYLTQLNKISESDGGWFSKLEAEFLQASVKRRKQNRINLTLSLILVATIAGLPLWRFAEINGIESDQNSAERNLVQNQNMDALVDAILAGKKLKKTWILKGFLQPDITLQNKVINTLQKTFYQVRERNHLDGKGKLLPLQITARETVSDQENYRLSSDGKVIMSVSKSSNEASDSSNNNDIVTLRDASSKKELGKIKQQLLLPGWRAKLIIDCSFDSKLVATVSQWLNKNDFINVWDWQGNRLAQFPANQGGVESIHFSPDGKQLTSVGNDGTVRIWQNLEGKPLSLAEFREGSITDMILSADGRLLAAANQDGTVQLWDWQKRQKISKLPEKIDSGSIKGISFSADNRLLAIGEEEGTIHRWNLENLEKPQKLSSFQGSDLSAPGSANSPQRGLSISHDGRWIATGGSEVTVYNQDMGQKPTPLPKDPVPEGDVSRNFRFPSTALNSDGSLLAVGDIDGQVYLRNLRELWNGQEQLQKHNQPFAAGIDRILSLSFSPKGDLLAVAGLHGSNGVVRLWNVPGGEVTEFKAELKGHRGKIEQVIFSPEGTRLATAGEDGTARVWDLSGQELAQFKEFNEVVSIAFSSDSKKLIAAGRTGRTDDDPLGKLWQVRQWQIEDLDQLLVRSCDWVRTYLTSRTESGERGLCDGIPAPVTTGDRSRSGGETIPIPTAVNPSKQANVEQNKVQSRPQNVPSPTPASNNGQNSYEQALSDRKQANKLNSTSVDAYINRGLTYHRQGNYQQAISNLNKAIALNPNSAKAYSNRAALYNEQKDYQKAIADSSKAISLNPTYANAYINRGVAYYYQGNSQQAIANYTKAIKLAPGNAIAYTNRGLAYARLGNQQAAQADRQKAAALSQRQSQ